MGLIGRSPKQGRMPLFAGDIGSDVVLWCADTNRPILRFTAKPTRSSPPSIPLLAGRLWSRVGMDLSCY